MKLKIVFIFVWFCSFIATSKAQNFLMQSLPDSSNLVGIQYLRPVFKQDKNLSSFAGVYSLYTNMLVSENFSVAINLPIMGYSTRDGVSEEGIGNIFVAGQFHNILNTNYKSVLTVGIYLPTVEDNKYMMQAFAVMTNPYNINSYMGNRFSIYTNYAYFGQPSRDFSFCIEAGPEISFLKDDVLDRSAEFFIHFGGRAALKINNMTLSSEYQGLWDLSKDHLNFTDKMIHTLLLGGQWNKGWFRPKGFYKFYLNKSLSDSFYGVIGVGIDFRF